MNGVRTNDEALYAPAAARNGAFILDILEDLLPRGSHILEVASGSGEHAVRFAAARPDWRWQPSDPDPRAVSSIAAHARAAGLANLLAPVALDSRAPVWPVTQADALVCINMIHIAPWAATVGLMAGALRTLQARGLLYLYGPFRVGSAHIAASNAQFDEDLRSHDPDWGVRDLEDVVALAAEHGLELSAQVAMPANNLSVVLRKVEA